MLSEPHFPDDDYNHSDRVWTVVFSPANSSGEFAAWPSQDNTIKVWDIKSRQFTQILRGHTDTVSSLAFSPDGLELCSTSDDGIVCVWDLRLVTDAPRKIIEGHGSPAISKHLELNLDGVVWDVAYSHSGELIAASDNQGVDIRDSVTGDSLRVISIVPNYRDSVVFWRNSLLVLVSEDSVSLWEVKDGKQVRTIHHPSDREEEFSRAQLSPDGCHLATCSDKIHIWEVKTGRLVLTMSPPSRHSRVVYSRDGKRLGSAGERSVCLWNASGGCCERKFEIPAIEGAFQSLAMSYSGGLLAAGSESGVILVWSTVHDTLLLLLEDDNRVVSGLEFVRGDSQLISASYDGIVCVWSASTGMRLRHFRAHDGYINSISVSHDGSHLATASDDHTMKIWDMTPGRAVWNAVFSHDGEKLATCCEGGTVRVWDLASNKHQVVLEGQDIPVYAVAFAHSGKSIAAASGDGSVLVRPLIDTPAASHALYGHRSAAWAVAYASDDCRLASTASDRTVRVWDTSTHACLQVFDIGVSLESIVFGVGDRYLRAATGRIDLGDHRHTATAVADAGDQEAPGLPKWQHDFAISEDRCWITDKGENLLWLPREYRPLSIAVNDTNDRICIGCRSGRVVFFDFTPSVAV